LQMSPEARKALKELGMPIRKPRAEKGKEKSNYEPPHVEELPESRTRTASPATQPTNNQAEGSRRSAKELSHRVENTGTSLGFVTPLGPRVHPDEKAFKVPVTFRVKHKGKDTKITMPLGMSHADQGSDLNLITESLVKVMGFPVLSLNDRGWSGLTMDTADGNESSLAAYTTFSMGVTGIWRRVHAFIRPEPKEGKKGELSLLLGLPWLNDVDAKFDIRQSRIDIGDTKAGERIVSLQGPMYVPSKQHKLVLHPKVPGVKSLCQPGQNYPMNLPLYDPQGSSTSSSNTDSSDDADDESDTDSSSGN
jgi:hypothetical protein